jgi:hypothetical protein
LKWEKPGKEEEEVLKHPKLLFFGWYF